MLDSDLTTHPPGLASDCPPPTYASCIAETTDASKTTMPGLFVEMGSH
jgi:hypothetical protein